MNDQLLKELIIAQKKTNELLQMLLVQLTPPVSIPSVWTDVSIPKYDTAIGYGVTHYWDNDKQEWVSRG